MHEKVWYSISVRHWHVRGAARMVLVCTGKHKHWSSEMHGLRGEVPPVRFLRYKRCVTLEDCCFGDASLGLVYGLSDVQDLGGIFPVVPSRCTSDCSCWFTSSTTILVS